MAPTVSAVFVGPTSTTASSTVDPVAPGGGALFSSAGQDVPAHTVLLCDHDDGPRKSAASVASDYGVASSGSMSRVRQQPRLSLHGKAISGVRQTPRRDARYRKVQAKIYNFLERPRGFRAISYHVLVFLLVFGCFCLTVLSTVPEYEESTQQPLFWMEVIVVVWFTGEFLLRMWSVGCRSRYQGAQGRLAFFKRPFTIIDTIVIVASIVVLGIGSHGQVFAASALRGLRFFQILRMVRMDRRGGSWKLLGSVVWAHRQELLTTFYIGFLCLIFASFLMYLVEKDVPGNNDKFNSFADALWWGVITLATVGYGDAVPITMKGKGIAGFCAILGISFFALPASILGSGFALKVQQQQRQKHLIRRRNPAALLIQCIWRCYAADPRSSSVATWEPYLRGLRQQTVSAANFAATVPSKLHASSTSFASRFSTIKRPKHMSNHLFASSSGGSGHGPHFPSGKGTMGHGQGNMPNLPHGKSSSAGDLLRRDNSARKTFSAPLDSNHRPAGIPSADGTVQHVLHQRRMALTQTEDIRRALEDDEDEVETPPPELTDPQRTAIRALRKMKYLVAKRKFREALKPYDVKDVIEQYSAGHVDLLARVKNLQQRLDQVLGKQNSKSLDAYDSKVCLAARVVKIERQVDEIETKVDTILELLIQQRNHRLLELGITSPSAILANLQTTTNQPAGQAPSGSSTPKLRPILMNHPSLTGPTFLDIPLETPGSGPNSPRQKSVKLHVARGHSSLGLVNSVEEEQLRGPEFGGIEAHSAPPVLDDHVLPDYEDFMAGGEQRTTEESIAMILAGDRIPGKVALFRRCEGDFGTVFEVVSPPVSARDLVMANCVEKNDPMFIDADSTELPSEE